MGNMVIDHHEYKAKEKIDSRHGSEIPSSSDSIFVAFMKYFDKCVQCMPPSPLTAVEMSVKYFARVENQQQCREKHKNQDKNSSDGKWKVLPT